MNAHAPVPTSMGQAVARKSGSPAHPLVGFLARAAAVIVAWALAAIGMSLLWQRGFGFPADQAWALAIGLLAMVSMLVTTLLLGYYALSHDA
jgi:hypothetical protein